MTILHRRSLLAALAAVPFAAGAQLNRQRRQQWQPAYTAATAPDAISRQALARSLKRIDQGGGGLAFAVHRNLPQIVAQNLARMDEPRMSRWLGNMGSHELQLMAQLYTTAAMNAGGSMPVLDVMANRLSGKQLADVARHFGYAPMQAAVLRSAPQKATEFDRLATPSIMAPVYGGVVAAPAASSGKTAMAGAVITPMAPSIEMTIYEIYLDFRTAPIGSMGVRAALYSTSVFTLGHLGVAFSAGYGLGSTLASVIQYVSPGFYEKAGDAIFEFMNDMKGLPPEDMGPAQSELGLGAGLFDMGESFGNIYEATGGDFQVVQEWHDWSYGGGGGGGICYDCHLV